MPTIRTRLTTEDRTRAGLASAERRVRTFAGDVRRITTGVIGGNIIDRGLQASVAQARRIITEGFDFAGQIEQSQLQLRFLATRSLEAQGSLNAAAEGARFAREQLVLLRGIARRSPLDLRGILRANTVLESFGGSLLTNRDFLQDFVDTMSVLGSTSGDSAQDVAEVARQTGQLFTRLRQGRAFGEDARVLVQRGILSVEYLELLNSTLQRIQREGLGGTEEAARIAADALQQAFQGLEGGAEAASQTLPGLRQQAGETFRSMVADVLQASGAVDSVKLGLTAVISEMERLQTIATSGPLGPYLLGLTLGGPFGTAIIGGTALSRLATGGSITGRGDINLPTPEDQAPRLPGGTGGAGEVQLGSLFRLFGARARGFPLEVQDDRVLDLTTSLDDLREAIEASQRLQTDATTRQFGLLLQPRGPADLARVRENLVDIQLAQRQRQEREFLAEVTRRQAEAVRIGRAVSDSIYNAIFTEGTFRERLQRAFAGIAADLSREILDEAISRFAAGQVSAAAIQTNLAGAAASSAVIAANLAGGAVSNFAAGGQFQRGILAAAGATGAGGVGVLAQSGAAGGVGVAAGAAGAAGSAAGAGAAGTAATAGLLTNPVGWAILAGTAIFAIWSSTRGGEDFRDNDCPDPGSYVAWTGGGGDAGAVRRAGGTPINIEVPVMLDSIEVGRGVGRVAIGA